MAPIGYTLQMPIDLSSSARSAASSQTDGGGVTYKSSGLFSTGSIIAIAVVFVIYLLIKR